VDTGVFGRYGADPYEDELVRLLLPVAHREFQMVWVPSWEPEGVVYVEKTSERGEPEAFRVVTLELPLNLHTQVFQWQAARKGPDGVIPSGPEDFRAAIEALAPTPARSEAPISPGTVAALRRVWQAALRGARLPSDDDGFTLDGTNLHFATWEPGAGYLTATAASPAPGTRCYELVTLGDQLARLAKVGASERQALEARIVQSANTLEAKF